MSSLQTVVPYLVVILVCVADIYCGDASVSANRQETPVAPVNINNAWQKLNNQDVSPLNPSWGNPNQQSPTTPWPALGARRPVNQPSNSNPNAPSWVRPGQSSAVQSNAQGTNSNRNIGIDLSYGLNPSNNHNPNQNNNPPRTNPNRANAASAGNRNVGVDLSYGINPGGTQSSVGKDQHLAAQNQLGKNQYGQTNQNHMNKAQTPLAGVVQNVGLPNKNQNVQNPATGAQGGAGSINQRKNSVPGFNTGTDQGQQNANVGDAAQKEDEELREFSEALLKKDVNNAAKYVVVKYQGKTTSRSTVDEAPEPLLSVKSEALDIPTIAKMLLLHNNYVLETNVNEYVTPQEKAEENNFLDAILSTSVMQHARNFLIQKGKISKDPKDFRDKLKEIWFGLYSRGGGKIGSSGFEHVFVAELKGNDVSGLHNWLYFSEAESKRKANYLGYLKKIEFGSKGAIVKHHFQLDGKDKPVGSMFIGTSPELEIALYSTCFLLKADEVCPLRLGGHNFIIRTYTYKYRGKKMIGSAFPEI